MSSQPASHQRPLPGVKQVIAIGSGKGGVGKSTTSVNLALALAHHGAQVGLVDVDIYGPNQPQLLGCQTAPSLTEDGFQPVMAHGLQTMSMGYLVDPDSPMIWRGPMITKALHQLLYQTAWNALDYLIVDLPPGTGDVQLSLVKNTPLAGVVIVTTPQDLSALDARKGLEMFRKVNVPVLGIVENMSTHTCSACGHQEAIFGTEGADTITAATGVPLLGRIPLHLTIRQTSDAGTPIMMTNPDDAISQSYRDIAQQLAQQLSNTAPSASPSSDTAL